MYPVSISVIPGTEVDTNRVSVPDPVEDYSLVLLTIEANKKTYQSGIVVKNTALPLSSEVMEQLRQVANEKMVKNGVRSTN